MATALRKYIAELQGGNEPATMLADELTALESIFLDGELQFVGDNGGTRVLMLVAPVEINGENQNARMEIMLPPDYPMSKEPPGIRLVNRTIGGNEVPQHLSSDVAVATNLNDWRAGEMILFEAIDTALESVKAWAATIEKAPSGKAKQPTRPQTANDTVVQQRSIPYEIIARIMRGETIYERKSEFLGHAARIHHLSDVPVILSHIVSSDKRIARATHPRIYAWVCKTPDGIMHHGVCLCLPDCDDGGESAAGGRLAFLLTRLVRPIISLEC